MRDIGNRRCYIHVGTHKTGTKTLQDVLTRSGSALADVGVHVVRAGRPIARAGSEFVANQNFAWEILEDPRFDASFGTIADLERELRSCAASIAVISSEGLCFAYEHALGLARLRDACLRAGYEPIVLIYLREQSSYATSLYDMFVTSDRLTITFERLASRMLDDASIGWDDFRVSFTLEYDRLLEPFVRCFGSDNVIARPYHRDTSTRELTDEFFGHIATELPIDFDRVFRSERLNRGHSCWTVMSALHQNYEAFFGSLPEPRRIAGELGISLDVLEAPFSPIGRDEAERFGRRFAASNAAIAQRYGFALECVVPESSVSRETQSAFIRACSKAWDPRG